MKACILKTDSKDMFIVDDFSGDLKGLQDIVGGYVEAMDLGSVGDGRRVTLWLNEEGKLHDLPPNFGVVQQDENGNLFLVDIVMGDVIITSSDDKGETVGLNDLEVELVNALFRGNIPIEANGFSVEKVLILG